MSEVTVFQLPIAGAEGDGEFETGGCGNEMMKFARRAREGWVKGGEEAGSFGWSLRRDGSARVTGVTMLR